MGPRPVVRGCCSRCRSRCFVRADDGIACLACGQSAPLIMPGRVPMPVRVEGLLRQLAGPAGIVAGYSQRDLAQRLGVSAGSIELALKELRRAGAVTSGRSVPSSRAARGP